MEDNKKILRVSGPDGMVRIYLCASDTFTDIFEKIEKNYKNLPSLYRLYFDPKNQIEIQNSDQKHQFTNGDLIYLTYNQPPNKNIISYDVDTLVEKNLGIINRQKTEKCNHNDNSKCIHCDSIEIIDHEYMKTIDPPPKHVSFHVFIRRKLRGVNKYY
uniref:Nuclear protein localization protein 4 homolog (Trinotate prediction) n=1 Tax=Henneguya salminicola TaxID=69463 RepID=A0A6G3MID8_HENSL